MQIKKADVKVLYLLQNKKVNSQDPAAFLVIQLKWRFKNKKTIAGKGCSCHPGCNLVHNFPRVSTTENNGTSFQVS